MRKPRLIYWDSCVFIHALQRTPQWEPMLAAIVRAAQSGDVHIVTSALTLVEVARSGDTGTDDAVIRGLFQNPYIIVRELDRGTATSARQIVRDHGLKPQDAVHVATAIAVRVSIMHTCDGSGKKRGLLDRDGQIGNPPLAIQVPSWSTQLPLIASPPPGDG
jgi:predicted nucleic acid-binding protein